MPSLQRNSLALTLLIFASLCELHRYSAANSQSIYVERLHLVKRHLSRTQRTTLFHRKRHTVSPFRASAAFLISSSMAQEVFPALKT